MPHPEASAEHGAQQASNIKTRECKECDVLKDMHHLVEERTCLASG